MNKIYFTLFSLCALTTMAAENWDNYDGWSNVSEDLFSPPGTVLPYYGIGEPKDEQQPFAQPSVLHSPLPRNENCQGAPIPPFHHNEHYQPVPTPARELNTSSPSSIIDKILAEQVMQIQALAVLLHAESQTNPGTSIQSEFELIYNQQLEQLMRLDKLKATLATRELMATIYNPTIINNNANFPGYQPFPPPTPLHVSNAVPSPVAGNNAFNVNFHPTPQPKQEASSRKRPPAAVAEPSSKRPRSMLVGEEEFEYDWKMIANSLEHSSPWIGPQLSGSSWFNTMMNEGKVYQTLVDGVDRPVWVVRTTDKESGYDNCRRNFTLSVAAKYVTINDKNDYGATAGFHNNFHHYFFAPRPIGKDGIVRKKVNPFNSK